jgi:hypothetical protein
MFPSWAYVTIAAIIGIVAIVITAIGNSPEQSQVILVQEPKENMTQTNIPKSSTITSTTINYSISGSLRYNTTLANHVEELLNKCEPVNMYLLYGLGSMKVLVKGQENDMCVMEIEREIEMGLVEFSCSVPVSKIRGWIGWRGVDEMPSIGGIESFCGTGKVWVDIEVSCIGISQRCYLAGDLSNPIGTNFVSDPNVVDFIKTYYKNKGITVFDVVYRPKSLSNCEFGECWDTYTLYILVPFSDIDKMLESGYKVTRFNPS